MMPVNAEEDYESITPSLESLKASLFGDLSKYTIAVNSNNRIGKANGVLTGGNLTLLSAQLGSTTQLNTKGTILFIEETGEYKYHIDRMLQSLKRAGYFEECSGVIVGDLSKIKANPMAWGSSVEQLIIDALKEYKFPIAFGIPAGHELDNRALIFGRKIALNVTPNKTEIAFE
jgi:muramoyltetrapeptide carboxypeptidase